MQLKACKNNKKENRLFPNHCMIHVNIKVSCKKKFARNFLTHNGDSRVKRAAEKRNDEKMLRKGRVTLCIEAAEG